MANPSENLIQLCRAAVEAHQTVTAQPYTPEAGSPGWTQQKRSSGR
ncbi:hypothetical protein [Streptomyces microflavus]